MQRKKYTEEQIIQALKEGEAGTPVGELCRKYCMDKVRTRTQFKLRCSAIKRKPTGNSNCRHEETGKGKMII